MAATDIVTMTQIPGSVSSLIEVTPFLMNGAVLCASGGTKSKLKEMSSIYHELECGSDNLFLFGANT